jgi:hypothetical protein
VGKFCTASVNTAFGYAIDLLIASYSVSVGLKFFTCVLMFNCGYYVQEAAALAATEVAFILQSGQGRGVHFTIAPDSPATPQHEPQP